MSSGLTAVLSDIIHKLFALFFYISVKNTGSPWYNYDD